MSFFVFIILHILLWLRKGKLILFREEDLSRFVCFSDMKHFYPSVHVLVWNDNTTEFSLHSDLYPFELFLKYLKTPNHNIYYIFTV